jgi:hypothetical protein
MGGHRTAARTSHIVVSDAQTRFELLEFTLPVQKDPTEYERLVRARAGSSSELIRWHISGPAAEQGMLKCEAVVLRPEGGTGSAKT